MRLSSITSEAAPAFDYAREFVSRVLDLTDGVTSTESCCASFAFAG